MNSPETRSPGGVGVWVYANDGSCRALTAIDEDDANDLAREAMHPRNLSVEVEVVGLVLQRWDRVGGQDNGLWREVSPKSPKPWLATAV